ncbi:universal stress protein [Streptomyces sp. NBC_01724]|uniref:universal stress protein n=1 Tax=unclassified Streptomyces TaxID=2593676 RepID=UPI002E328C3A|nr:universal stress protein [Streptomyces sp. NBC_01724]WTE57351.1 universal stress protein [Streptomyces sp. NBC_01617]WTE64777.1 universal stress protein [Streptomyces sp. NBC_01617]WTI84868.1 universal stress protein [Streptomyces sp. NBC_00724]WTI92058.1 universal stress protein [Streptomyces sp. NBC_00724]
MDASGQTPRVVVGVDGSPASYEALRWAVRYARLVAATVDAVAAYELPGAIGWSAPALDAEIAEAQTRRAMTDEIRKVLLQVGEVPMEQHLVRGGAAGALIAASGGAQLLVVGSRGRGGFASLLLGSVSQQCAAHASCPVVIVRPDATGDGETTDQV